jgi:F1F0 ATPase subunit 2
MMDSTSLLLAISTGILAGRLYFAGLWWTMRLLPMLARPLRYAAISFCFRLAALLSIYMAVMQSDWRKMLVCLAGFALTGCWAVCRQPGGVFSSRKARIIGPPCDIELNALHPKPRPQRSALHYPL